MKDSDDVITGFHRWYYENNVWDRTSFLGVKCLKSVLDLWNYQEILAEIRPGLVIEMGSYLGGATLFFSVILAKINPDGAVIALDTKPDRIDPRVCGQENVRIVCASSTDPSTAALLKNERIGRAGPAFVILDTKHDKEHVLAEMINLRSVLKSGDYLIVEDSNFNGHPVLPGFGPGPMEAIMEYETLYPDDYVHDSSRENKFGFTFAPRGFLIRADFEPAKPAGNHASR